MVNTLSDDAIVRLKISLIDGKVAWQASYPARSPLPAVRCGKDGLVSVDGMTQGVASPCFVTMEILYP